MLIGGLDIGTTGAKITVTDDIGQMLFTGYEAYPARRNSGAHEINASDIWNAVKTLLRNAASAAPGLAAVGITSFGESFVLLDEKGQVLLPTMLYTDPRGEEQAARLQDRLGDEYISRVAGVGSHSMYSLPKLMWIREHRPDIFSATRHVCLIADYLVYNLTGRSIIDYSLAARTMGFDIQKKAWSAEIFDAAGVDQTLFGTPVPTGTDAGAVLPEVAEELGLPSNLHIVLCCQDQVAAAIGSGVTQPGLATDGGGTVQCMTPIFSSVPQDGSLQQNHYAVVPFLNDAFCCYAFSFTGGALVKWFVDQFAESYRMQAAQAGVTVYQHMEGQMPDLPTGILTLPHFAGAATPYMDVNSQGAFVGLELSHTPIDLFQAIMEGIAYEMRINMEKLAEGGICIQALNATGGCAKSRFWLQMKADILGIPITRMHVDEAGTVGGIMLTAVAIGRYGSVEEAVEYLVHPAETYQPRPVAHTRYEPHYQRYRRLYAAIRPLAKAEMPTHTEITA